MICNNIQDRFWVFWKLQQLQVFLGSEFKLRILVENKDVEGFHKHNLKGIDPANWSFCNVTKI